MKQLRYGELRYLVGDDLADALMEYAAALARAGSASHVTMNVLDVNGMVEEVELLVGPATMMIMEPANDEYREPENTDVTATLRSTTAELDTASSA